MIGVCAHGFAWYVSATLTLDETGAKLTHTHTQTQQMYTHFAHTQQHLGTLASSVLPPIFHQGYRMTNCMLLKLVSLFERNYACIAQMVEIVCKRFLSCPQSLYLTNVVSQLTRDECFIDSRKLALCPCT